MAANEAAVLERLKKGDTGRGLKIVERRGVRKTFERTAAFSLMDPVLCALYELSVYLSL